MNQEPEKPMVLVALLLAAFMINLDTTIVNVALPTLVRELHASTVQLEWIVDAYNLMFAALVSIVPLGMARQDYRLFYTAGLSVKLNTYPTTHKIHAGMLRDLDRWVQARIQYEDYEQLPG